MSNKGFPDFYGNVVEVIMILGAVGSFLGGVDAVFPNVISNLKQSIETAEQKAAKPKPISIVKNCLPDDFGSSQAPYSVLGSVEFQALPPSAVSSEEDNIADSDAEEDNF